MATPLLGDRQLARAEIQQLDRADQIAAFFAGLGYDISARVPLTPAALGITAESLQRKVRRIERLASQDAGTFEVYLVELDSVTLAAIQGLARAFRDRAGNYLLVLTAGYDDLDFVLIERELPRATTSGFAPPRVSVRPRVLTVDRRDPGVVALRVLRRFTYTEADAEAQYDKLRAAYDVAEWSEPLFNNRGLFADYFLNERLRELPEWSEDPRPAFRVLAQLYRSARERFGGAGEAATRRDLVEPVLRALGFAVGPPVGGDGAPDNLLALEPGGPPAVAALAYTWDRFLDGRADDRDAARPADNPGARVVSVLQKAGAPWAIVTNGRLWRLYAAAADSQATNYYEVDLEEALAAPDPSDAFRYFWLIFRAAAFQPRPVEIEGEQRALCFVERLVRESAAYARRLGDQLKERVFDDVFLDLARGFIVHRRAAEPGVELSSAELDAVFRGTLTLLYRLLFLLYAEARDLLPARQTRGYWEKSLARLKAEVAEKAGTIADEVPARLEKAYAASPSQTALYDRLLDLALAIDRGDATLNLPLYNGGLFLSEVAPDDSTPEAEAARFLRRDKVPDRYLARALDRLARDVDSKTHALAPIDYKSLGVRQLGSIYEGLLEFRLRIASEKLAVVKGKKTEEIVPYAEAVKEKRIILTAGRGKNAPERTLPKGTVYLENDRRERKATGSYYTPDDIVKYIVERAVGPVLAEHLERFRPELRAAQKAYREAQQRNQAFRVQGLPGDDPEKVANDPRWRELVDDLFAFRALDPAMGSGHFLVEAADFVADRVLDFLNGFPWNPVTAQLRQTRESILAEMDRQGVTVDPGRLTDVNLLKRHVLKRCVYGVDLNPMAVELAKVSLWLHCFTLGAPLSFLDHHLKCGNSLIGTTVEAVEAELAERKQGHVGDLFGGPFQGLLTATAEVEELARLPDATVEEARRSRSLWAAIDREIAPYKAALDIWVSRFFGNERAEEYLTLVGGDYVAQIASGGKNLSPEYRQVIANAAALKRTMRFFHWDLEFPEAFLDAEARSWKPVDRRGFDAVIGNPPYVRQELLAPLKPYLKAAYTSFDSVADLYIYFYERGIRLLRRSGRLAFISSGTFARAAFAKPFRRYVNGAARLDTVVDFGENQPFPEAEMVRPSIVVIARERQDGAFRSLFISDKVPTLLDEAVARDGVDCDPSALALPEWTFQSGDEAHLLDKLLQCGRPLLDAIDNRMFYGIKTGRNEAFVIDGRTRQRLIEQDSSSGDLIKTYLQGQVLRPWYQEDADRWAIVLPSGSTRDRFGAPRDEVDAWERFRAANPALAAHLATFEAVARRRQDQGQFWWELRACDYYAEFDKPKVIWPDIAKLPRFSWDESGAFVGDTAYILTGASPALLGILQSRPIWFSISRICQPLRLRAGLWQYRLKPQFMGRLPIPDISSDQDRALGELAMRLTGLARERYSLDQQARHRILADLGKPGRRLNLKLTEWWLLSFAECREQLRSALGAEIPAHEQAQWQAWLTTQCGEHERLTAQIVALEKDLNARIYELFDLTKNEIELIEKTTRYQYGEV